MKVDSLKKVRLAAAATLALVATAPAHALTATLNAGPVMLPTALPVHVCIDSQCIDTPNLDVVSLGVKVSVEKLLGVLPTIIPSTCPSGQVGVALLVNANTANTKISLNVTGKIANSLLSVTQPIGPVVVPVNRTVVVNACTY